jgi:hypothetical protein
MNAGARWALLLCWLALSPAAFAQALRIEQIGEGPVPVAGIGNAELSGITWAGESRYFAVDDGRSRLFPLDVTLDEASGEIARILAGEFVSLRGARDVEGIAWLAKSRTVLVTDETAHEVREYDPVSGELRRSIPAPPPFRGRMRQNRGFEGVAASPDGATIWIANEGPLRLDGAAANALEGAWVRLQQLDGSLAPVRQYAYQTEPGLGFVGVVDLMIAPRGELLVLERALTGAGFAARIFAVDFSGASDVTAVEKLRKPDDFEGVRKERLWERTGGFQNFEGVALGPELPGGGRLVLLVSDGGGQRPPTLLALRLTYTASPAAADEPRRATPPPGPARPSSPRAGARPRSPSPPPPASLRAGTAPTRRRA